jgi:hypothetical protein
MSDACQQFGLASKVSTANLRVLRSIAIIIGIIAIITIAT